MQFKVAFSRLGELYEVDVIEDEATRTFYFVLESNLHQGYNFRVVHRGQFAVVDHDLSFIESEFSKADNRMILQLLEDLLTPQKLKKMTRIYR